MENKKTGLVIQVKYLEEFKPQPDKVFYVFGVGLKYKTEDGKFLKDVGLYYSPIKEQTYFTEGMNVDYYIDKNETEPKKSKIRAVIEKKENKSNNVAIGIDEYNKRKMADAVAFSASYAKDVVIADTTKDFITIADIIYNWQLDKLKAL